MAALRLDLASDTVRGALLALVGLVLVGIGAAIPVPTGGGVEAVAAGLAVMLGLASLLLGVVLFLLATRL